MPHANDALLSTVIDLAGDALVVLDGQGRITAFGSACAPLFGRTAAETLGLPFATLFAGQQVDADTLEAWGGAREVVGRHRDGSPIALRVDVTTVEAAGERQFVAVLQLRPAADEAHAERLALIAAMGPALAHELSQPLTAAALYLRAAEGLIGADDAAAAFVGKARHEAERAGRIIRALRRFAENRPPETTAVDFDSTVDEALDLALVGRSPPSDIRRSRNPEGLTVVADPVQVQQVVVNLVRNGLDAVADQSTARLWITTEREGGTVRLSVRDSGPGMAKVAADRPFAPFQSAKPGGLGLGLAISRTIAERHGGSISIEPGGDGRGATVSLVLPLAGPAEHHVVQRSS